MAELLRMKGRNSALGARIRYDGLRSIEYHDSRADYRRQYYALKKMKNGIDGRVEAQNEYRRKYYAEHPEKSKAYSKGDYDRQYYLLHKDKKSEYNRKWRMRNCSVDGTTDRRGYNLQNKEKTTEYQQEYYNRHDDLIAEIRRLYYLGKKEYLRLHSGSQRTNLSWRTPEIVREYFEFIASRLNISNITDWYRISRTQMNEYGGISLYDKFGSLGTALQYAYPQLNWDQSLFGHRGKKSGQRWLKLKIEEMLPGIDIIEDYQHPELTWDGHSDRNIELDLWIPKHQIGIEFQGEHHYFNVDCRGPSIGTGGYSERDRLKINLCESRGITLIAIPYWWDGSMESLSALLYQARPDVFPVSHGTPIPREMPFARVCLHRSLTNESQMIGDRLHLPASQLESFE